MHFTCSSSCHGFAERNAEGAVGDVHLVAALVAQVAHLREHGAVARPHRRGRRPVKRDDDGTRELLREKDDTIAYQAPEIERLGMGVEALKGQRRLEMRLAAAEGPLKVG